MLYGWDHALHETAAAIVGITAYLISDVSQRMRRRRHEQKLGSYVDKTSHRDRDIYVQLAEVGTLLRAKRSYVVSYHNGDHFIDGSDILRKSRTHEWAAHGVTYESERFQNILVSLLPEETRIVNAKECWVPVSNISEGRFKRLLQAGDVDAIARCPVRRSNDVIGFIGLDFDCDEKRPSGIDDIVRQYAWRIEEIMNRSKSERNGSRRS